MTTLASFYSSLQALSVTGVTDLDNPPTINDLGTANLPVKWVDSIGFDAEPLRAKGVGGLRTLRARLVVVTDAAGQDRHAARWTAARTMLDTLDTALKTLSGTYYRLVYSMDVDPRFWDGWFAVVADITLEDL